ncbi:MAG TPA: universal stress protein [Coleofasciculaceae cyanobacterium]
MVFKKILVALDRSPQSELVFTQALEIAQEGESRLLLFHGLSWDTDGQWTPYIGTIADVDIYGTFHRLQRERLQQEIENVHSWLKIYCQQAQSKNIPTEFDCRVGGSGSKICEAASNWGADLIVLGRRGHKGLSEILLGSVSNYTVHHAPCSVLIVQGVKLPTVKTLVVADWVNTSNSL